MRRDGSTQTFPKISVVVGSLRMSSIAAAARHPEFGIPVGRFAHFWGFWVVDRSPGRNTPDLDGFKHNQQPLLDHDMKKCSMKTTKLRLSKIVTPFPVFEENWDPVTVITMADDQGHTLDVKLLELLCFTR